MKENGDFTFHRNLFRLVSSEINKVNLTKTALHT